MSQLPSPTGLTPRAKPGLDVYGVLIMIATVFVLLATIYILVKSVALFGSPLPVAGD